MIFGAQALVILILARFSLKEAYHLLASQIQVSANQVAPPVLGSSQNSLTMVTFYLEESWGTL